MRLFVPGRICLFGEHSDWVGGYRRINAEITKGYPLICGTDQGIIAGVDTQLTRMVLSFNLPDSSRFGLHETPMHFYR